MEGKGRRKGYRVLSAGEKPFLAAPGTGRQVWRDGQKDGGMAGRVEAGWKVEGAVNEGAALEGLDGNVDGIAAH